MNFVKAFKPTEYERRVSDVKNRMVRNGFDVIICQDPASMFWLTGCDGWSFYTPQAVLVHLETPHPVWFGRAQDAKSAHLTTDLPADNIVSYSEHLVHHSEKHPFDELCDLILEYGLEKSRIGVDFDAHYYTARAHAHLLNGLPNARIADNTGLVNWARLVKSEAELGYMVEAGIIATETMKRALDCVAPGVRQYEIAAEIYQSQVVGHGDLYGDYTSLCPLIQVGDGTCTPHLTWTGEPLPDSGPVVLELAAARRHYHTPLTRTAYLGRPPDSVLRLAAVIVEGGDKAIETARPGVTCAEVEAAWQRVLNHNGYSKDSRVGYSIGVGFPPDWGERTASLRPGDNTVLEPNMCFHFQSGVWLEDFGAGISESIVVTENGGKRLTHVPRELAIAAC